MEPWIDLADAKAHLNKTSSVDDAELVRFLSAACSMIEDIKGHVAPVTVTETHRVTVVPESHRGYYRRYPVRQNLILLGERPVLTVTSVDYLPGDGTSVTLAQEDMAADVIDSGWRVVDTVLHLPVWTGWVGAYRVTYQAGLDPVPANYELAALELVAHLWRTSQMNATAGGRPQLGEPDTDWMRGMTYAMPLRVRELLGLYGTVVADAGVVIG